ncbi:MAG TPA: hypothetical protein VHQ70_00800 [Syntrophomonadaceae bacterium]|nr:hypothetical protein [Syntrophomonadaceae bacterium]
MNIGIDIDNTITRTSEMIMKYANIYGKENNLPTELDLTKYFLEDSLKWSQENIDRFLDNCLIDAYKRVDPKENAAEVIRELHKTNYITLVTSRNQQFQSLTETTLNWLNDNKIEYDKLIMNNTENMHHFSKLSVCMENNVEVMIEDHHDLAYELSERIPVLMFDYPYNAHMVADNIIRITNWRQVPTIIARLDHTQNQYDCR